MDSSFRLALAAALLLSFGAVPLAESPAPRAPTAAELQSAQWVEGRVILPAGTPADERVTVVADANGLPAFARHTSDVGADGRFRVAFAADARRGKLGVQGRFVFLETEHAWKSGDKEPDLVLQPVLGARVVGRIALPADATASERAEVLTRKVEVEGTPLAPGRAGEKRTAHIAAGLTCELNALATDCQWTLTLVTGPFVPLSVSVGSIVPGRTHDIECVLVRGATVRGKVVDEQGAPVAGAAIGLVSHEDPLAPAPLDTLEQKSAADGAFTIRGIAPGVVTVWATRAGWINVDTELAPLASGEERTGVSIVLRAGHVLVGRTQDSAGQPLAGARVRVTQSRFALTDSVHDVVTDAAGKFQVEGLSDEHVDVLATAETMVADAPTSSGAARPVRKRVMRATALDVDPRSRDLVLTLVPGLVVEGRVHDDMGRSVQSYVIGARRVPSADVATPSTSPAADELRRLDVRAPDGVFALEGLEPGTWDVYAFGRGIVYEPARRIEVPYAGEALVFVVRRPAVVSGTVLDLQRKPVASALVEIAWDRAPLYPGAPTHESTSVTSGRDGKFEITDVHPGTVTVTARHQDGRVSAPLEIVCASGALQPDVEVVLPAKGP